MFRLARRFAAAAASAAAADGGPLRHQTRGPASRLPHSYYYRSCAPVRAPRLHAVVVASAAASSTMGTNADLSRVATASTLEMEWVASPVPNVWRKRVFHTGGTESGRVTSVVKYGENSAFHDHPHPEGEEIFVLEGTFSDKRGDHKPGTLLLNPEGFEHAPFSEEGCVILVRLRQYPGNRPQKAVDSNTMGWEEADISASKPIRRKQLFQDNSFEDTIELQLWEKGTERIVLQAPHGIEMFVVSGECESRGEPSTKFCKQSWLRVPADQSVELQCSTDCTVYLKVNGLPLAEPLKA